MELNTYSPVWHPYTPGISGKEILIDHGAGAFLYTKEGRKITDCISSWWVNIHGHAHPTIAEAIGNQAKKLEQVIFAGFTHEPAEELAQRILPKLPGEMKRVFFSDNGSTAVEVGIKMALQYFHIKGEKKNKLLALRNSYHGDTFGAMAMGERGPFSSAFRDHLFNVDFIEVPYRNFGQNPSPDFWKAELEQAKKQLSDPGVAALLVEPLIQGAGGMLMYPSEWLDEVFSFAQSLGILCIADEVFTGFYRTGNAFATSVLRNPPDIICLSKGLTAGFLPMGLTVTNEKVSTPFLPRDYDHTLYHGHSFTGNPLACAAALASLDLIEQPGFEVMVSILVEEQYKFAEKVNHFFPKVSARCVGTIFALTLQKEDGLDYTHPIRQKIYSYFMERDLLIRPIGNVLYLAPPYCIEMDELKRVHLEVMAFLQSINS